MCQILLKMVKVWITIIFQALPFVSWRFGDLYRRSGLGDFSREGWHWFVSASSVIQLACRNKSVFTFAARDEQRGKEAVSQLNSEGLSPKFHQLDLLSVESIEKFKNFLQEQYGGLDILVNNAAIAYKVGFVLTSIYKPCLKIKIKYVTIFIISFCWIILSFSSRRHQQPHLKSRLKLLCAQISKELLMFVMYYFLSWDRMQGVTTSLYHYLENTY